MHSALIIAFKCGGPGALSAPTSRFGLPIGRPGRLHPASLAHLRCMRQRRRRGSASTSAATSTGLPLHSDWGMIAVDGKSTEGARDCLRPRTDSLTSAGPMMIMISFAADPVEIMTRSSGVLLQGSGRRKPTSPHAETHPARRLFTCLAADMQVSRWPAQKWPEGSG